MRFFLDPEMRRPKLSLSYDLSSHILMGIGFCSGRNHRACGPFLKASQKKRSVWSIYPIDKVRVFIVTALQRGVRFHAHLQVDITEKDYI